MVNWLITKQISSHTSCAGLATLAAVCGVRVNLAMRFFLVILVLLSCRSYSFDTECGLGEANLIESTKLSLLTEVTSPSYSSSLNGYEFKINLTHLIGHIGHRYKIVESNGADTDHFTFLLQKIDSDLISKDIENLSNLGSLDNLISYTPDATWDQQTLERLANFQLHQSLWEALLQSRVAVTKIETSSNQTEAMMHRYESSDGQIFFEGIKVTDIDGKVIWDNCFGTPIITP